MDASTPKYQQFNRFDSSHFRFLPTRNALQIVRRADCNAFVEERFTGAQVRLACNYFLSSSRAIVTGGGAIISDDPTDAPLVPLLFLADRSVSADSFLYPSLVPRSFRDTILPVIHIRAFS